MTQWEELASKFLRELAKRDMKAWRAHQSREECAQIEVEQRDSAGPPASREDHPAETNCVRLIRAALTSPDYMERNT